MSNVNNDANLTNQERAVRLASQPYRIQVITEKISDDSDTTVFVAENPELLGCIATGDTVAEALAELRFVREQYILHLLDHNVPVPGPSISRETAFEGFSFLAHIDISKLAQSTQSRLSAPDPEPQNTGAKSNFYTLAGNVLEFA